MSEIEQRWRAVACALLGAWLAACGARTGPLDLAAGESVADAGTGAAIDDAAMMARDVGAPASDAGVSIDALGEPDAATLVPDFAWYRLDETTGTTAHDATPHHYDVEVGGVVWGDGATFDQNCGEVNVDARFRVPPVTITAWLRPVTRSDEGVNGGYALTPFPPDALCGDVPSFGGYGVGLDVWSGSPGGAAVDVEAGIDATIAFHSISGPFAAGARHFVAFVTDGESALVYVDGGLFFNGTADAPPPASPTPLHLGCTNDDASYFTRRFFAGNIRDARVYTRALDATDITALFVAGPA